MYTYIILYVASTLSSSSITLGTGEGSQDSNPELLSMSLGGR